MSYSGEEVAGFSAASAAPVVRVVGPLLTMRKTVICKCSLEFHPFFFKKIPVLRKFLISGNHNFWKCGYIGGAAACVYNAVEV